MICTDFSGVAYSAIINSAMREKVTLDEQIVKHIAISTFRNIHVALAKEYGNHLLICDHRSWRKDVFPFYKANRKRDDSEESAIDWEMLFRVMDELKEAFDKHFPFHVITVPNTEADDVIAAFAVKAKEPVVIVSKDHDFHQLHSAKVKQYNPSKKKFIDIPDPKEARLMHIIGGCAGDGVPNVLSDDDAFVNSSKRQKALRQNKIAMCLEYAKDDFNSAPAELKKNWDRNKLLVDLTSPVDFALAAVDKYYAQGPKEVSQNDTANWLASQRMVMLLGKITDFYKGIRNQSTEEPKGPLSNFM